MYPYQRGRCWRSRAPTAEQPSSPTSGARTAVAVAVEAPTVWRGCSRRPSTCLGRGDPPCYPRKPRQPDPSLCRQGMRPPPLAMLQNRHILCYLHIRFDLLDRNTPGWLTRQKHSLLYLWLTKQTHTSCVTFQFHNVEECKNDSVVHISLTMKTTKLLPSWRSDLHLSSMNVSGGFWLVVAVWRWAGGGTCMWWVSAFEVSIDVCACNHGNRYTTSFCRCFYTTILLTNCVTINLSWNHLKWRMFWQKAGNYVFFITHPIWVNQRTEFSVYRWLCAPAMFEVTCYPAFVWASDVISSALSKR